ncbi:MAG: STAS domain-containing protein [Fibrobacteria bacterium]|nr:STAS domain-containing protein [Fibrobacteria bacterium]
MQNFWEIKERSFGTTLTLLSEWDIDRVNEFSNYVNENLKPEKNQNFVVDLQHVEFIDSMALGVLIHLKRIFESEGGFVYLLKPSKTVEKVLQQSGVIKIFTIFHSEPDLITFIQNKKSEHSGE